MGLDMRLSATVYAMRGSEKESTGLVNMITVEGTPITISAEEVASIEITICQWRNASAIHFWMLRQTETENDSYVKIPCNRGTLKMLLSDIEEVLADESKANLLLPDMPRLFKNANAYDDLYFRKLKQTKEAIEEALARNLHWFSYVATS